MSPLRHIALFVVLISVHLLAGCRGQQTHYITPDYTATPCTDYSPSCFTLDDYVSRNATETFLSDTTVVFLPGVHYLSADDHITIHNVNNVSLRGLESPVSGSEGRLSHIVCTGGSGFYFLNTINIKITNLTISRCGSTTIVESASSVLAVNVSNLDISHTVIKNSPGYALFGVDVLGNSTIRNSHFLFNNYDNEDKYMILCLNLSLNLLECIGGGAIFRYDDNILGYSSDSQLHTLRVISSLFAYGVSNGPSTGSGLTVSFEQCLYGVEVVVSESVFTRNTARIGANMAFFMTSGVSNTSVTIQGCNSTDSNYHFMPSLQNIRGRDYIGGGMYFTNGIPSSQIQQANNMLKVYNTNFVNNSGVVGAAMSLDLFNIAFSYVPLVYVIENCSFVNNSGSPGSALAVSQVDIIASSPTLAIQLVFRNCSFFGNSYPSTFLPNSIQDFEQDLFNVVFLNSVQDITFTNCRLNENTGTALYTYATRLRFFGNISIERNSGLNGGGLSLSGESLMLLSPNTHIYFLDNSALNKGGGIIVANQKLAKRQSCFFQIDLSSIGTHNENYTLFYTISALNIHLVMDRNTAMKSGSALYGGTVDSCGFLDPQVVYLSNYNSGYLFNQLFHCDNTICDNSYRNNISLVSSDPFQICFCDTPGNIHNCSSKVPQITVYPGQTFNVSVSIFGQRMGFSTGVVFANFFSKSLQEWLILEATQYTQEVERSCTMLTYTIFSQAGDLNMKLTLEEASILENSTDILIHVLPCPPGFNSTLFPSQLSCQCDSFLQSYHIPCDIEKGTVHRTQQQWLSINLYKANTTNTKELLIHEHCPLDYCLPEDLDFNLSNPDLQCSFNRTGILCGMCPEGLSATFGGSQCVVCSNAYLALLIPFAAAGLCLVLLLFIFNTLTVATGTLNGLVLYANIVQYNQGILFPPSEINVLTVFVSWINLDLGIYTCFYNGMDTYAKTWLQFVFPMYMWVIVVAIIVASKYSSRVARLAGKNAVPVFATLGLLSFAKILRTIITALSITLIYHSDGGITTAWLFDANINITNLHMPLLVVSMLSLLGLVLPFAILLTFTSQLHTLSSHHPFMIRWVNRLKPFFDAYQGPYKDKHRHWTGVLLFTRGFLFLIYALNGPGVNLLVTILASFLLVAYGWLSGGVYKKWSVNALELSFYLNLGFLASTSIYVRYAGGSQAGVIYTSTSIALVEFLGVIVYSFLLRLAGHFGWTSIKDVRGRVFFHVHDRKSDASQEDICEAKNPESSTASVVSIIELPLDSYSVLREPLLEDNN